MKKTIFFIGSAIVITALIVASCQKNYNNAGTQPIKPKNQLFADIQTTSQNFTIKAGRDTTIYGSQGTKLHFYVNSFKDAAGNIVTSGNIGIQLWEMYKPGEMIQNRATTSTTDDQPLRSGGQVRIVVNMNGQELFANKYGIGFRQPAADTAQAMRLYYGNRENPDSVVKWTTPNTTDPGTSTTGTTPDTTPTPTGTKEDFRYVFDSCTSFNFVNADHYIEGSSKYNIRVVFPDDSYSFMNTQIYVCLPASNTVISLRMFGSKVQNSIIETINVLPESACKYIIITCVNEKYYYCQRDGIVRGDTLKVDAVMTEETRGDIMARMQGL